MSLLPHASKFSYFLSPSKRSDDIAVQALQLDGAPLGFQDLAVALLGEYRQERRAAVIVKMQDGLALIRDFQRWAEPQLRRAAALSCDAEMVEWMRMRDSRVWG